MKSEVPAGKPYQTMGGAPPTVGFSSESHPASNAGMSNLYGDRGPGSGSLDGPPSSRQDAAFGTPTPGSERMGAPTDHRYGAPGTSGLASTEGGSAGLTNSLLQSQPTASETLSKDPAASSKIPGSDGGPGGSYP
ncbi:hypothetical protein [Aquisphaera giovannonii]|uniref:hypothetical protein n=1 Tax=Aquisphaera giovannonii TaxID=406548 RepID=UPI001AEFFFFC|nr:hypothetical protein [Aquisphaera giovannonii]